MRELWRRWQALKARSRAARWGQDALFALVLFGAVFAWQTRNHVGAGAPLPAFTLTDVSGKTWSSEALRGKKSVLHFWAPWCPVCATETGAYSSFARSQQGDANVLSVVLAYEGPEDIQAFIDRHGVDYPVLVGNDDVMRAFRVDSFPTTYFVSEDGRITRSTAGYTTGLGLRWRLWF